MEVLDRHGVEYLVVGGVAARAYGAVRPTADFDCLVRRAESNLDRLAGAMQELNARIRTEGLSDDEAKRLPVQVTAASLARMEVSTWRTDAGHLDVLADLPARDGRRQLYEDLTAGAHIIEAAGFSLRAASLPDIIASKEWANRPKDEQALPELRELAAAQRAWGSSGLFFRENPTTAIITPARMKSPPTTTRPPAPILAPSTLWYFCRAPPIMITVTPAMNSANATLVRVLRRRLTIFCHPTPSL